MKGHAKQIAHSNETITIENEIKYRSCDLNFEFSAVRCMDSHSKLKNAHGKLCRNYNYNIKLHY